MYTRKYHFYLKFPQFLREMRRLLLLFSHIHVLLSFLPSFFDLQSWQTQHCTRKHWSLCLFLFFFPFDFQPGPLYLSYIVAIVLTHLFIPSLENGCQVNFRRYNGRRFDLFVWFFLKMNETCLCLMKRFYCSFINDSADTDITSSFLSLHNTLLLWNIPSIDLYW